MLPEALDDDGVAYLMQLSILGQERTAELLDERGFDGPRRRLQLLPVQPSTSAEAREQIERVE